MRALILVVLVLAACYRQRSSAGGGQADVGPRLIRPADARVPEGYVLEPVATGLTFPTGVAFDAQGTPYVTEAGYSYGEVFTTPRLLRVQPDGSTRQIAAGGNPPWTGVAFHRGSFYVAEGGEKGGGRIARVAQDGTLVPLVQDLPTMGDHHTNGPVVGPDGMLYFALGTFTNSGVVGEDNAQYGWLKRHPDFHDIPCADVTLAGVNFRSADVLRGSGQVETGAYLPFGTPSREGQVIHGQVPCSGAILKISPDGGPPELVAWGFRNPFGLAFSPEGTLYAADNGYDERGSRPVWGVADQLWRVQQGLWYGWPDASGGELLNQPRFKLPGRDAPPPLLLAKRPNDPPAPVALFGVHSSTDGIDFSRSDGFGHKGQLFAAQFGDLSPKAGKVLGPVGFKVVRVDVRNGVIDDFAVNSGGSNGPASALKQGGLERPVSVRFDPSGNALYVVDFGIITAGQSGLLPRRETGVLWRITRKAQ